VAILRFLQSPEVGGGSSDNTQPGRLPGLLIACSDVLYQGSSSQMIVILNAFVDERSCHPRRGYKDLLSLRISNAASGEFSPCRLHAANGLPLVPNAAGAWK
jgi:hypothetical protein